MKPAELEQIRTGYTRATMRPGVGIALQLLAHIDEQETRIAQLERQLRDVGQRWLWSGADGRLS